MNIPVIGCCVEDLLGRVRNCTMDGAMREAGYLFKYRTNVTELEQNLEKLKGVLSRVEDRVEEYRRNARNVYEDVSNWLKIADKMKKDLEAFLGDEIQKRADGVCFKLPFPNLYYRFKLGREATKKSAAVSDLIRNGETFEKTDHEIAHLPPRVEESAAADHKYQIFESREKVLKDIVAALQYDTVARVGIYGMPGVGKTTMIEQVRSQLVGERYFEEVALAVVSANLDVKSIQRQLACDLELTDLAGKEDERERARLLKRRLNSGKKVLLILDDVWSKLPLADMGIDFGDAKFCKILMTSRKERVCDDNNCRPFKIELLNEAEAWCLFKQHAGDCIEKQDIRPLAEKVLKECGKLPLVIRAIGEALKGGELFDWEDALVQFKNFCPQKIANVDEQVYKTLELSFNLLKPAEAKVCLLLCSTFEEDYEIRIEELTRLAKAMGHLLDMDSLREARNRVLSLVKVLKSSGLLLEGRDEDTVKMHDVIRDVAVSIVAPKVLNYEILVKSGYTTEWPLAEETCQRYGAIRLTCDRAVKLPKILECPQLQAFSLIVNAYRNPIEVPNTFFDRLEELNALQMRDVSISSALLSLPNPTNLRMLRLEGHNLELDMTTLKGLRKLEVLFLRDEETIEKLPLELRELENLRVLDLKECRALSVIEPGVLSSLSYLEELYLPHHYKWDAKVTTNETASTSILDELFSLTRVTRLNICIPDIMTFPDLEFCRKLVWYNIGVGKALEGSQTSQYKGTTRGISIVSETYVDLKGGIKVLVEGAEFLDLRHIRHGLQRVFYESNGGGFVDLKKLGVYYSIGTEYLLNYRQLSLGSFSKLERLGVSSCGFKYLFSVSVARGLEQLQSLYVSKCQAMEAIVRNECNEDEGEIIFHNLKSLDLDDLESLSSFYSERRKTGENPNSNPAQSLFNEKVAFPALERLVIHDLGSLRCIWEDKYQIGISFPELRSLTVKECTRLVNVVSFAMLRRLQNSEELITRACAAVTSEVWLQNLIEFVVENCGEVRELFDLEGLDSQKSDYGLLSRISTLELEGLGKLQFLWNNGSHGFLGLEVLVIDGCSILKNMFSCSVARGLGQLRVLVIRLCPGMEEVIYEDEGGKGRTGDQIVFPRLKWLKLETLPKLTTFCSANYALNMPSLAAVGLYECHQMANFTSGQIFTPRIAISPGPRQSLWITDLNNYLQATVDGNDDDVTPCDDDGEFKRYGIFHFGNMNRSDDDLVSLLARLCHACK